MDLIGTMVDGVSYAFFLNPATFSGAIDIIAVKQPDGSFKSTPFHVRFGKFQLLQCKEQIVDVEVNDQPVDVKMKIGGAGEVFFLSESSPEVDLDSSTEIELDSEKSLRNMSQLQLTSSDNNSKKLVKWSWGGFPKILRSTSTLKLAEETQEEENTQQNDENVDEVTVTLADEEKRPTEPQRISKMGSILSIFKRNKPQYLSKGCDEGDFVDYQYVAQNGAESDEFFNTKELNSTNEYEDLSDESADEDTKDNNNNNNNSNDNDDDDSKGSSSDDENGIIVIEGKIEREREGDHHSIKKRGKEERLRVSQAEEALYYSANLNLVDDLLKQQQEEQQQIEESLNNNANNNANNNNDNDKDNNKEKGKNDNQKEIEDEKTRKKFKDVFNEVVKTETVSTIKINDDIAQDFEGKKEVVVKEEKVKDIHDGTENTIEKNIKIGYSNAILNNLNGKENSLPNVEYFTPNLNFQSANNSENRLENNKNELENEDQLSRRRVAFTGEFTAIYTPTRHSNSDLIKSLTENNITNVEEEIVFPNLSLLHSISDKLSLLNHEFEFSLCARMIFGPFSMTKSQMMEIFKAHIISFDKYEPSVFQNEDLVVRIGEGLYPWTVAQSAVFSLLVFNQPINKETLEKLGEQEYQKRLKKNSWSSWIYPWRRKSVDSTPPSPSISSSSAPVITTPPVSPVAVAVTQPQINEKQKTQRVRTVRSLRPTSEQISAMNLQPGANKVAFTVNTELRGKQTVISTIYLWDSSAKLIISDIDGTITRSDALGHVLPMLGRDWSHSGVAKLLTAIRNNGYHIIYLTSRPIGQAQTTRNFLTNLKQDGNIMLPKGPVFMSPDRLFTAINREMIRKKPQEFKIACLKDIKNIFPNNKNPFYSGFGNRNTDVMSYQAVGISSENVFIINPQGEIHTTNQTSKKSYDSLTDLVDELYPAIITENTVSEDYNDWNFLKTPSSDDSSEESTTSS